MIDNNLTEQEYLFLVAGFLENDAQVTGLNFEEKKFILKIIYKSNFNLNLIKTIADSCVFELELINITDLKDDPILKSYYQSFYISP